MKYFLKLIILGEFNLPYRPTEVIINLINANIPYNLHLFILIVEREKVWIFRIFSLFAFQTLPAYQILASKGTYLIDANLHYNFYPFVFPKVKGSKILVQIFSHLLKQDAKF